MTLNVIVDLAVKWGPTALFILIILLAFLKGFRRGYRKSLILAINALIAFAIVVVGYILIVSNSSTDSYIVTLTNQVLNSFGQDSLQSMLSVSESTESLTGILTEVITESMNLGDGVEIVVKENGAYLGALVNSAYHLIFAVLLSIVYLVLVFILYIFYLIFFSEKRYKKKKNKAYVKGKGKPYKKKRLKGGLVGSLRGLVAGLVTLSFLGSLLFVVTGGDGTKDSEDVKFGDAQIDEYYDLYESVSEYGNYGIYSLLNKLKDKDNVPYYLYAADLVLSGSYEDKENNVNAEIVYREEFACYVKFVRSTIELLIKYGADDITPILNGGEGDIQEALTNTFAKEGFKDEFNVIIDEFEENTFFINFALSAVDSIARNIKDFDFYNELDQQSKDILAILLTGEDAITVSNIINKEDAKILLSTVITIMADGMTSEEGTSNTLDTIKYIKDLLPQVTKLSMFTDEEKKAKGNKVLTNIYDYVISSLENKDENVNISMTSDNILKLTNKTVNQINWMDELASLIDVGIDALTIYENNYNEENQVSALLHMLDADNPNKEVNKTSLDNIINKVSKSEILGLALSTTYVKDMLVNALSSLVEGVVLPNEVEYIRTFNPDGTVKNEGEIYTLLTSLELLLENGFADFYDKLQSDEGFESENEQFSDLADLLLKETNGKSVLSSLLKSKLLKYTLSQVLTSIELEGFTIVIPEECQETVPEEVIIINDETLSSLVENITLLLPTDSEQMIDVKNILVNKDTILENKILHSTIVMFLVNTFSGDDVAITIPEDYITTKESLENSYSQNIWVTTSEVSNILNGLDAIFNITTSEEEFDINNIALDTIKISTSNVSVVVESKVLHSTISEVVIDTLTSSEIEVPEEAKDGQLLSKIEIISLIDALATILGVEEIQVNEFDVDNITLKSEDVSTLFSSYIIKRKVTEEVNKASSIKFVDQIYENSTRLDIKSSEVTKLLHSLEILLGAEDGIDFNDINVSDISINTATISDVLDSVIFMQIVSDNVLNNETIKNSIPTSATTLENEYTVNGVSTKLITKSELVNLVNALAIIISDEDIEDGVEIDINDININTISLKSSDIDGLFSSYIIKRKVTEEVNKATSIDFVDQIYEDSTRLDVKASEVESLLKALEEILNSPNGIDFNSLDVANVEISKANVTEALKSTIFTQIVSDNILNNASISGMIPLKAVNTNVYTYNGSAVTFINTTEIENLINVIDVLFGESLSNETSFDINNASISYGVIEGSTDTKGNLKSILSSSIIEFMISDKIIETLQKLPKTCITEVEVYESTTTSYIINQSELGKLIQIIGSNKGDDVYEISVSSGMDFNAFDRDKVTFIGESEIARYKVSEILLTQNDLVIPYQCVEEISLTNQTNKEKVLSSSEFKKVLKALKAVIPTGAGFNEVSVKMPSSADYNDVMASDILRATITSKIKINGNSAVLFASDVDYDKDVFASLSNSNVAIPVLKSVEAIRILNAIELLTSGSTEFEMSLDLNGLKSLDMSTINTLLECGMIRYQISEMLKISNIYQTASSTSQVIDVKDESNIVLVSGYELAAHALIPTSYGISSTKFVNTSIHVLGSGLDSATVLDKDSILVWFYLIKNLI